MIDKAQTVPSEKVGSAIGRLNDRTMVAVNQALAVFLGFA
jgi:mRNA interferase MazF